LSDNKKLPATDAELMEALADPSKHVEIDNGKTPTKFLKTFNISPGNQLLLRDYLYKVYVKWNTDAPDYRQKFYLEVAETLSYKPPYYLASIGSKDFRENFIDPFSRFSVRKPKYDRKIAAFLRQMDIVSGNTPIEGFLLYYLYDKYLYERDYVTPSIKHFYEVLKRQDVFKQQPSKYGPVFYVNKNVYNLLTEQEVTNVRESRRKAKDKENLEKVSQSKSKRKSKD